MAQGAVVRNDQNGTIYVNICARERDSHADAVEMFLNKCYEAINCASKWPPAPGYRRVLYTTATKEEKTVKNSQT